MSTTFDARDGDSARQPSHLALADEAALRSLFLSEFPALTAEARADLGDDARALAPKVVEGSFVRAWDARARFRTPEEVHQFLVEDVHHAAARALSRRAGARRLKGHEHSDPHAVVEPTPEEAWKHIQHALHGETHSPAALAAAAAVARHGAAEHITAVTRETPAWKPIAGLVAVVVGLTALGMWMSHLSKPTRYANALNSPDARTISAPSAQTGVVTLDDGSRVQLSPATKLIVAKGFGPELRAVRLEGTAAFDVAPNTDSEFRVMAGGVGIVATGTSFTVRANPGDSAVTLVVTSGAVQVGADEAMRPVTAGTAVVATRGSTRPASVEEREEADAWRKGTLVVANRSLEEVIALLGRWYGLNISAQPALLDRRVTLRASLDSTRAAIRGVEQSTGLQFGYAGQNMVFQESTTKAVKTPAARGRQ